MGFGKDLRKGYSAMAHPGAESKQPFGMGRTLRFYYELTAIPFVLYIVIGYLLSGAGIATRLMPFYSSFSALGAALALLISAVLYFWIITPIGIFIDALIYQLVGKNFLRLWNGTYEKTFTAVMFGALPIMLFYWLIAIPVVNAFYLGIFGVWSLVVLTVALANQQKIKRIEAFWAVGIAVAFGLIFVFVFMSLLATSFLPFATTPLP